MLAEKSISLDRPARAPRLAEPAAAASFLDAPSPLARPPRPRHSLRHLARLAEPAGLAPRLADHEALRDLALRDLAAGRVAEAALILGDIGRACAVVVITLDPPPNDVMV
ncbi:hypothetical protein ZWY2020_003959 [Hordeum vulgare]|nr:hypothetical protein ZWY2020_003959 [Hordeum vulgare]